MVVGRARQVALKRYFRTRLVVASLLWLAGLLILFAKMASLDSTYDSEAGFYVSAGLLGLGFISTLTMWPSDLPVVKVDGKGMAREPTAAAAPR